ncbi:unnamed protein product [Parascedosporium putredinis]|uniref:Transcription factor Pcc1 n=1 Tax=Parascedosporium putredinis TaxID=1442378 RepID=A0A9P1H683_9PEZI|nr:unnamed protein product [Parascedosporium putredinis]CAI7998454.1 unnamed protein product [Parascedosporium putredinis]
MADVQAFPCSISLSIPFPTPRLASIALSAISRPRRRPGSVLEVEYRATTNRMLRVATNSFMESLSLVLEVMEKMDVPALVPKTSDPLPLATAAVTGS